MPDPHPPIFMYKKMRMTTLFTAMQKWHRLPLFLAAIALMAACGGRMGGSDVQQADTLAAGADSLAEAGAGHISTKFATAHWADSTEVKTDSQVRVSLTCQYLPDHTALADSIAAWTCEQVEDTLHRYAADVSRLVREKGATRYKADCREVRQLLSAEDAPQLICLDYEVKTSPVYEDDQYITMHSAIYVYLGGAHGSYIDGGATFRKSDGRRMGWDLLKGMGRKELTDRIKKGLMPYFSVTNLDDLCEMLLIGDIFDDVQKRHAFDHDFPLPATAPYLTKDGIQIIYQQYEIAPYAAGLPSCVIKP